MKIRISRSSVQRILRRKPGKPAAVARKAKPQSGLKARRAHHVWLIDVTQITSFLGLVRVRVVAIVDACTRAVIATGVSRSEPTSPWMCAFLARAMSGVKATPAHLVSDRGSQFTAVDFRRLLRRRGVRHRFGAVGRHGSIALIERFWRTLKTECLDAACVWLSSSVLAAKVSTYVEWFNGERVHQGLRGRTPTDASKRTRRSKPMKIMKDDVLTVVRRDLHGDPKLPVYSLRRATA